MPRETAIQRAYREIGRRAGRASAKTRTAEDMRRLASLPRQPRARCACGCGKSRHRMRRTPDGLQRIGRCAACACAGYRAA